LLLFDALLHVLIVKVKFANAVIGAKTLVVVGDDVFESGFFAFGILLVVRLFLRQVFLDLKDVLVAVGRRGKDATDIQRLKTQRRVSAVRLNRLEQVEIFNGVVDGSGGQQGVELAPAGGGVVLAQNGFDNGLLA